MPISEDGPATLADVTDCDLLVVGSGAAGLSAAVTAAHYGLRVVVVEKERHLGGTSAVSGGWLYLPGNPRGAAAGDTRADIEAYLRDLAGDCYQESLVNAFLDNIPGMLDFFEQKTKVRFVYPDLAPDYQMSAPGAKRAGRCVYAEPIDARELGANRLRISPYLGEITVLGVMPQIGPDLQRFLNANRSAGSFLYVTRRLLRNWGERLVYRRGLDLSNGNALIARLVLSAADAGVTMVTGTAVSELIADGDAVTGARLTSGGRPATVKARRGVVLACGGFSHSAALRDSFFQHTANGTGHFSPTSAGHSGENHRLGTSVGAEFSTRVGQPAAWAPVTVFRGRRGRRRVFPHLRGVGLPGIIAVDRHGRRFTNESDSYHEFGQAMMRAHGTGGEVHAYLIADSRTMNRYGIGFAKPLPFPRLRYYLNGYLHSARSLEALAAKLGIDAGNLVHTVATFNAGVAAEKDPVFHRGEDEFNWFKGDMSHKPNPSLGPVIKPPFFAVKVNMGDLGTFAGLATDEYGQVTRADGHAISGLYAAGSAAVSVFGGAYPGHGANLGPAVTWGYVIGRRVADLPAAAGTQSGASRPVQSPSRKAAS
jgi:succinate dehydrogenase/fumarate reductase flavoprotein subunit